MKKKSDKGFIPVENYIKNKYDIRVNEISNIMECKPKAAKAYQQLNEDSLYRDIINNGKDVKMSDLVSILKSDFTPRYNPITNYFKTLAPWDAKTDHIEALAGYIKVKGDQNFFKQQLKKTFVRCVACSLGDDFNKQSMTFISEAQNMGKSSLIRWFCPPALAEYIIQNPSVDKDGQIALAENFIINLDEMANFDRKDINAYKAIMSTSAIKVRRPYARTASYAPRIANVFGNTNKLDFLNDETGNVRWLCFELENINFEYSVKCDINKIWAQAYYLWLDGFKYNLTADELAINERNCKNFHAVSMEEELINKHYVSIDKEEYEKNATSEFIKGDYKFYTASDFLIKLTAHYPAAFKSNVYHIGKALTMLNFKKQSNYNDEKKYTEKGYYVFTKIKEKYD
jgi:predicted P-loop ATPase